MKLTISCALLFFAQLVISSSCVKTEDADELVAVNSYIRHGDRTPWKFYKNDPYQNSSFWTKPMGELTNLGKLQLYNVGIWLRKQYGNFLSDLYKVDEINVRSSDVDRCLMSASSALAGLFPPSGDDIWLDNFPWQPIPVHGVPKNQDDISEAESSCPKLDPLMQETEATDIYFTSLNAKNVELYEYLTEKSGENVTDFYGVTDLYDILYTETLFNLTLPEWTQAVFPDKMTESYDANYNLLTYTPELAKMFIGRFYDQLNEQFMYFSGEKNDTTYEKFFINAGHQDQTFAILNVLEIPNLQAHSIPYAATTIFELRRNNGEMYVNLMYKTEEDHADRILIPACENINCPLEKFMEIIEPIRVTSEEWKLKCGVYE